MNRFEQIAELESRYLIPTYARYPLLIERGKGVYIFDDKGNRYIDFIGGIGVNALGHAHPRMLRAMREQAAKVVHTSNLYYSEYQGLLAQKLAGLSGLDRAFFSNSGTEAIEGALKLARLAGHRAGGEGKYRVVALKGSYHGRSYGAMSMTGQGKYQEGFEPLLTGVTHVERNDLEGLRAAVNGQTCAIIMEPIFGEGGIRECSPEFLREARALATEHRAALIFDEIQCGLGRTGKMFAYQRAGVTPDILAIAKPIAGGVPLGAFLATEEFSSAIHAGQHGSTFGGGPLACRLALEYLSIVEDDGLLARAAAIGEYLQAQFRELARSRTAISEVRGAGCMQAIELDFPARPLVEEGIIAGVLFNVTQDVVIRLLPAYILEEKHVDKLVRVLKKLLGKKRAKVSK